MVKEGNKAPYFCLSGLDEKGEEKEISLKDFKGKIVFLYFYTKNNAPGCT
ncbi:MAG TPA: redoxin domain-containing protein [Nitrospinota bacterium]|jgi:peroxiredoxin Q/BCP|nr:redoxin domain-containing protein [Nitrospinota bacterium]|tara:strand:- start:447 stop:596 length:150 start_codon:yes stop_codon:yes gene_type:complete